MSWWKSERFAAFESWYQRRARLQAIGCALDFAHVHTLLLFQCACCAVYSLAIDLLTGVAGVFLGAVAEGFQDQLKRLPKFENMPLPLVSSLSGLY